MTTRRDLMAALLSIAPAALAIRVAQASVGPEHKGEGHPQFLFVQSAEGLA